MKRWQSVATGVGLVGVVLSVAGCDLIGLLQPRETNVNLVNNGEFPVRVEIRVSGDQNIPRDVLEETGSMLEYTIPAGQTVSFSRDCDNLQAIMIDNAELRVVGAVGPDTDTDVFRDGSDFGCGDTIVFTFDHTDVLIDFDISTSFVSN